MLNYNMNTGQLVLPVVRKPPLMCAVFLDKHIKTTNIYNWFSVTSARWNSVKNNLTFVLLFLMQAFWSILIALRKWRKKGREKKCFSALHYMPRKYLIPCE